MTKKEWRLTFDCGSYGNETIDMVAHCETTEGLISTGPIIKDGKYVGTVTAKTHNFFKRQRKPKKALKMVAYALAHHLAVNFFTGGKKGLADDMVMECFSLLENRGIRKARREYRPPTLDTLCLVGETLKKSVIVLLNEPENIKQGDNYFSYRGDAIYWHGALEKAVYGEINLESNNKSEGGKITFMK